MAQEMLTVAYETAHRREPPPASDTAVAVAAVAIETPAAPVATQSAAQPFTKVVRDPAKYQVALARAHAIGAIKGSEKLHALCRQQMEQESVEVFYVVCLDLHGCLTDFGELARGQRSHVEIEVEDLWQFIALTRPHGYAIVHCHPSGSARPSRADRALTQTIRRSSKRLFPHTAFLDSMIIGQRQYYSFADHQWK